MFKWLSSLFAVPPHFTASWVAIPELKLAFDVVTGELEFGNGQHVKLGSKLFDVAPLGQPDVVDGESPLVYTAHGIVIFATNGIIDRFNISFYQGPPPALSANGQPLDLSETSDLAALVAAFGPPEKTHSDDENTITGVEYQVAKGTYIEWYFNDGKLSDFMFVEFDDVVSDAEALEDEETW